jgi:hypothetical protein
MEIVHNFVKTHGAPRAGLEIDESATIQTVCMQAVMKATDGGEWVLRRCSRSHRATVAIDDSDYCLVEGVNRSTQL